MERYIHVRYMFRDRESGMNLQVSDWAATVCLFNADDDTVHAGVALCNPKDNFTKSIGRKISSGRAMFNPALIVDCNVNHLSGYDFKRIAEDAICMFVRDKIKDDRKRRRIVADLDIDPAYIEEYIC